MRLLAAAALAFPLLLPAPAAAQAVEPHASWPFLSFSNGHGAAMFNLAQRKLSILREHLYAHRDASTSTRELAYDAYWGVRNNGQSEWLQSRSIDEAGWDGKTGIARVVQHSGNVRTTQYWFSPFGVETPLVVAVVDVENTGTAPLVDAALFSLGNFHLGADGGITDERIVWANDAFEEVGERGLMLHRPMPAPAQHSTSPYNPYSAVVTGAHLVSSDDSGVGYDRTTGFEWDLTGLAPLERRRFAVVYAYSPVRDRAALDALLAPAGATPDELLDGARADWAAFYAGTRSPANLTPDQQAVYDRQLAVMRMAQVREPGRGFGQVVASLPPGMWNIAWTRDQAYATWGMIAAGMEQEAHDALAFLLGAQASTYVCCDRDGGPWVGEPYAISVTRYYGDGTEESDWNSAGPNIEFDGFGLTLATLADYVDATGDRSLLEAHQAEIFGGTADVLLGLIETGGAADGLIRADSSIWETHWYDGGRQHFAYTQATAVLGLRAAARLADHLGRTEQAVHYRTRADALATAAVARLVDPQTKVVRASLEQTSFYVDAAAVSFILFGLVPPDGEIADATMSAFELGLRIGVTGHGYARNDDGGEYDRREWAVIDLWIAQAKRMGGRPGPADELIAWITDQARLNYDLIPENFDRTTADYQGEVPMAGFGAGAYVTALWQIGGTGPGDGDAGMTGGDAGPENGADEPAGGCCDARGGAAPGSLLLSLALALALRARRRTARPRTASAGGSAWSPWSAGC